MGGRTGYIPEGFHSVTSYLIGPGTERLMEFLEKAFDARETFRMARPDGTIGHATMNIGGEMVEMADPMEGQAMLSALHLYVPNADETYRRAIEAGGTPLYEPRDMPYGDREGGLRDPSGNEWYIATCRRGGQFVPVGFRSITPTLRVIRATALLEFLEKAFGAKVVEKDMDATSGLSHGTLQIDGSVLECSEARGEWGPCTATLHVYVPDVDAAYERALAAGATSLQEPKDQFYGERNSGVMDGWGNHWYIATHLEALTEAEVRRRAVEQAKAAG